MNDDYVFHNPHNGEDYIIDTSHGQPNQNVGIYKFEVIVE